MISKAKEGKYLKERISKAKTQREAAKSAGISPRTAIRLEKNPRIQSEMTIALNVAGATPGKIASTVFESLNATKVISANIIRRGSTADDRDGMKDADENTKDFIDVPDYQTRIRAADLCGRFRSDFLERQEVKHSGAIGLSLADDLSDDVLRKIAAGIEEKKIERA